MLEALYTVLTEQIRTLFNNVLNSYVSSESDAIANSFSIDADEEEFEENDEQYRYEMSRIATKVEEWRQELEELLDDEQS